MAKYDFDAVVIGGGAAGLTASGIAANFGAKTMMVEAERLGGDCTWTGCVPSKALLKAGKVAQTMREAGDYGLAASEPEVDFRKVVERIHEIREDIYEDADAPENFEAMGIEVVQGRASFRDPHTIEITLKDGDIRSVSSRYFFICTGAEAAVPPIQGLDTVHFYTNESFFEADSLPQELIILGGGPIGCEMAQAMCRLGSRVTVLDKSDRILGHDDPELAEVVFSKLTGEGVEFMLNARILNVQKEDNRILILAEEDGQEFRVAGDALLVAAGRKVNTDRLNLDAAGVNYGDKGIEIDEKCRTNRSHVYACGDATGEYQFTHMSEHMAKVAVTNALLKYPMKIDRDHVPWCTYTDPELAHVGATEKQLLDENIKYEVYRFPYSRIDRAVTDSEEEGLIKIFAKKWNGKILGASVVGVHAGELISEYALAMRNGVTLRNMADTIHPYPSYGLGARRAADQWYIKNQSEWSVRIIQKIFGYRGEIPDFSDPDRIV